MSNDIEYLTLRKITWRIVPFVMFAYFIAFFDRINIGFAALTMNRDLGFSSSVFGLGAGLFFVGYFITCDHHIAYANTHLLKNSILLKPGIRPDCPM